jgi:tripartite-type tricarboxylate transporter receptor subunit TctC
VTQIAQVPTLHESGYALEVHNWWGLLAPAGTSAEWIAQLHSDVNTVLSSAEMSQRLASEGAEVNPISRDDFSRMITEDMQRWSQVARSTGIRAE